MLCSAHDKEPVHKVLHGDRGGRVVCLKGRLFGGHLSQQMKKLKEKEQNYCQPDVAVITDNGGYTSSVNSKISMY